MELEQGKECITVITQAWEEKKLLTMWCVVWSRRRRTRRRSEHGHVKEDRDASKRYVCLEPPRCHKPPREREPLTFSFEWDQKTKKPIWAGK